MDMTVRKVLRDFIRWQGKNDLLKDELTIDYEVAESYLEDTQKELSDYRVVSSKLLCILDNVDGDGLTKGREYDVLSEKDGMYCIVDDRGKLQIYGDIFFDKL